MSSKKNRAVTATLPAAPEDNGGFGAEEPAAAPVSNGKAPKKTVCPITRAQFEKHAPGVLRCNIGGRDVLAERREFSTGSLGYYSQGKIALEVDGKLVTYQCSVSLQVVGSKELPA